MVLHEVGTEQGVLTIQEYLLTQVLIKQSLTVHAVMQDVPNCKSEADSYLTERQEVNRTADAHSKNT